MNSRSIPATSSCCIRTVLLRRKARRANSSGSIGCAKAPRSASPETADEIKDGIIADLMAHIGTQKIHDDITLVVMKHR
jgi:hypothetical protein